MLAGVGAGAWAGERSVGDTPVAGHAATARSDPVAPSGWGLTLVMAAAAGSAAVVGLRRRELGRERMLASRLSAPEPAPGAGAALIALGVASWCAWQAGGLLAANVTDVEGSLRRHAMTSLGAYAAGFSALALGAAMLTTRGVARLGLRPRAADALVGLLLLLLVYPALYVVGAVGQAAAEAAARLRDSPPPESVAHSTLRLLFGGESAHDAWWWVTVLGAALLAPIFEELVYRGCLQNGLTTGLWAVGDGAGRERRRVVAVWGGIVLSAGLFAAVHAGAAEPQALPVLFVFGVALGVVYERTGRIGPAAALHASFNVLNLVIASRMSA